MGNARENLREWMTRQVLTPACGFTLKDWVRLLAKNRFMIPPRFWPRAALVTLNSMSTSFSRRLEARGFMDSVKVGKVKSPLFILGHWRSGTTHLHNLLSLDTRFAYPNFFDATQPHVMLSTRQRHRHASFFRLMAPRTRLIDNVRTGIEAPMEDEVALAVLTGISPVFEYLFPRCRDPRFKHLTLRDLSREELARWQQGLKYFLQKMAIQYDRPALLKSPPHTCRIKAILEVFPDARFVHIHRHPLHVFQSHRRAVGIMENMLRVGPRSNLDLDQWIIDQYRVMYDCFFEERSLIPKGNFHEISYEDLEMHPMQQLRALYGALNLPAFREVEFEMKRYLHSISGYRKSALSELSASLKHRIIAAWRPCFQEWGYAESADETVTSSGESQADAVAIKATLPC